MEWNLHTLFSFFLFCGGRGASPLRGIPVGVRAHITWVPSLVGTHCNGMADRLTSQAFRVLAVNPDATFTYSYVNGRIQSFVNKTNTSQLASYCHAGSPGSIH